MSQDPKHPNHAPRRSTPTLPQTWLTRVPRGRSPSWGYADAAYTDDIRAATREMRSALVDGSGTEVLSAYVNYAFGDETLAEVYGHEPWKVRKLQRLKARYDPEGAFNFYMPIRG